MEILNIVIRAVGWTILHSLWQSALLFVILNFIFISKPGLSARSRHNLSFLTLAGIFSWVIITFCTELSGLIAMGKGLVNTSFLSSSSTASNLINLPLAVRNMIEQNIHWIVLIYMIGFMIQLTFLFANYYKIARIRTSGLTALSSDIHQRFLDLATRIGIKRQIRFNISAIVSVPMVIGYVKPVILLPLSAITQLGTDQLEAILIHELAHIRRNDYLLNLVKVFIETVLFFNPFVLLTGRMIDAERENACDDHVVQMTGNPLVYIETLYHIQELKYDQERFSMAISGKNYQLLNRIKRIANGDTGKFGSKQPVALLLLLVAFFALAWIPVKYEKKAVANALKINKVLSGKAVAEIKESSSAIAIRKPEEDHGSVRNEAEPSKQFSDSINKPILNHTVPERDRAEVENLLRQLPDIQIDKDGKITAQGVPVSRVRIDGKDVDITSINLADPPDGTKSP